MGTNSGPIAIPSESDLGGISYPFKHTNWERIRITPPMAKWTTSFIPPLYLRGRDILPWINSLTLDDITSVTEFWNLHTDPIICLDGAATSLLVIQYNLVSNVGYLLGLLLNIAELLADMPPTMPVLGRTCFAVVFARLLVNSESQGIRPFIVRLNDGFNMSPGISARIDPQRGNSAPLNHCLTSFDRVILPSSALLGNLEISGSHRLHFLSSIRRISVGTLALTSTSIPCLEIASSIALQYSLHRVVQGNGGMVPIFSFRTQQIPTITAIAQAFVLRAFHQRVIKLFVDETLSPFVQHEIATTFKAVVIRDAITSHSALAERCGTQGLFRMKYEELPLLKGIFSSCPSVSLRSFSFTSTVCLHPLIPTASYIGTRPGLWRNIDLLFPEAEDTGLRNLRLTLSRTAKKSFANQLLSSDELEDMQDSAIQRALPHAEKWVAEMHANPYISAPIVSVTFIHVNNCEVEESLEGTRK
ncbi:hypothetical protein FB451DRAFT_1178655 [Mycena latifolia]|nr:hypothetical protein FB451DRAFT_1178655 [Mycena latifolia]